jgi:hypothetical protein
MCFVWISEQTAIISLYSINWLVCITETECVYCAVRTGALYVIQVTLVCKVFSTAAGPRRTAAATCTTLTGTLEVYFLHYIPSDLLFVSNNGTCSQLSFILRPSETWHTAPFDSTQLRAKEIENVNLSLCLVRI